MPFPDSPRVIYRKNPLAEVICQLRFPPILKIDAEPPARLQDAIRAHYPLYSEASTRVLLPPNLPPEITKLIQDLGALRSAGLQHEFASPDKTWEATLTREALALKTTQYQRWEDFRARLERLHEAFRGEYRPAFYTRIGLRYVDVIRRSALGLADVPWSEILKPHIAGEFSAPDIAERIETAFRAVLIRVDDSGGRVMIRHGIAVAEPTKEPCFVIDSDFFTEEQSEAANVLNILDRFNRAAGELFRWCIQSGLHTALEPQSVDPR